MLTAREEDYQGWHISTSCRENKAAQWKSGDPVPCLGRARVQLTSPQKIANGWSSIDVHTIPQEGELAFSGWPEAHRELIRRAKKFIDSLRAETHDHRPPYLVADSENLKSG